MGKEWEESSRQLKQETFILLKGRKEMEFSTLFKTNPLKTIFSPNGEYVATASSYRLIVKHAQSLSVMQIFTCLDEITQLEFSPDSQYILAGQSKRGRVQIFSVQRNDRQWDIDQGVAGLSYCAFTPNSRQVLLWADFNLRISVMQFGQVAQESVPRLNEKKTGQKVSCVAQIKFPKFSNGKGYDFSNDGALFAMVERKEGMDYLTLYEARSWKLHKHFSIQTKNCADVKFARNGKYIAVYESILNYQILIYTCGGQLIKSYSAYENALGIKSVNWAPNSQLLAVGSYDEKVRILDQLSWNVITTMEHTSALTDESLLIFREETINHDSATTRYALAEKPIYLKSLELQYNKPNPQKGISLLEWNRTATYLMTRNDNLPNVLWIWDMSLLALKCVLIHQDHILDASWDPIRNRLALCTGNSKIYTWSEKGCAVADVPLANFKIQSLSWAPSNGDALILMDHHSYCMCYPSQSQ